MTTPITPLPTLPLPEARERAIQLLSDGYAYDRLSESEFEWRLERLGKSESIAAIDALVADLVAPPANLHASAGIVPLSGDERRIFSLMSNARHEGVWSVPGVLAVKAVMSEVRIDLRHAVLPSACAITVNAIMANVKIIVPPELPVHFDVGSFMASTRNSAAPTRLTLPGVPHVSVNGFALMSEVRVVVRPR